MHRLAKKSFRIGNRGKLTLCSVLKTIEEHRLYLELGYSTVAGYAQAHFGYRRTETYEAVRTSRALDALPKSRVAFARGRIGWSKVKLIARVATPETEAEWLDHAKRHTVEQLEAEVRDAAAKRRDTPRSERYGLPNLEQRLVMRFSRSELEKVRLGLSRLQEEVAAKTGQDDVPLRDLLLYLCERLAAGGTEELEARSGSAPLPYAVVYHRCPACRASGIQTTEGLVEVPADEVDRVEGDAHVELVEEDGNPQRPAPDVDRPTPPKMRPPILLREGLRCANPNCGKKAHQCHHIQLRSEGGPTRMCNEIALCSTCHALVHAGLLKVTGRPGEALEWTTAGSALDQGVLKESAEVEGLPVIQLPTGCPDDNASGYPDGGHGTTRPVAPLGTLPSDLLRDLIGGLENLGFDKRTAKADLLRAAAELPPGQCTEKTLLEAAFRYRRDRNRAGRRVTGDVRIPVPARSPHPDAGRPSGRPESGRSAPPPDPG
jgi:hypothetical protein